MIPSSAEERGDSRKGIHAGIPAFGGFARGGLYWTGMRRGVFRSDGIERIQSVRGAVVMDVPADVSVDGFVPENTGDALLFCKNCGDLLDTIACILHDEMKSLQENDPAGYAVLRLDRHRLTALLHQQVSFFKEHAEAICAFVPDSVQDLSERNDHLQKIVRGYLDLMYGFDRESYPVG